MLKGGKQSLRKLSWTYYIKESPICFLSDREVEIIKLISEGQTNKQIAEKLFLSIHTIGTHRKNIFRKLQIRNSSELILYALKKGIITPVTERPNGRYHP